MIKIGYIRDVKYAIYSDFIFGGFSLETYIHMWLMFDSVYMMNVRPPKKIGTCHRRSGYCKRAEYLLLNGINQK